MMTSQQYDAHTCARPIGPPAGAAAGHLTARSLSFTSSNSGSRLDRRRWAPLRGSGGRHQENLEALIWRLLTGKDVRPVNSFAAAVAAARSCFIQKESMDVFLVQSKSRPQGASACLHSAGLQSDETDFPIVLAMKRDYPMTGANGQTHVSTAPITSKDISTVFAPPDRVNIAKDLLGSKAGTISVQSWPRASEVTQRVMRDGEAGLRWYLRTDGLDLGGG